MAPDVQTASVDNQMAASMTAESATLAQPSTMLPTMADLDRLQLELDQIDATLRALDS